jgi:hypothetical protein
MVRAQHRTHQETTKHVVLPPWLRCACTLVEFSTTVTFRARDRQEGGHVYLVAGVRGVPRRPGRDTDRTAPERSQKKKLRGYVPPLRIWLLFPRF